MIEKYILNENGDPIPEPDLLKWARWMEQHSHEVSPYGARVAMTYVNGWKVSTVFLGLNATWETMTFAPDGTPDRQERCRGNREQAEAMHHAMVLLTCNEHAA